MTHSKRKRHPVAGWILFLVAAGIFSQIHSALNDTVGIFWSYVLSFLITGPPFVIVQRVLLRSTYPDAKVLPGQPVVLYLRPFSADSSAYFNIERPIVQIARRYGSLVSFGQPNVKAALGVRMPRSETGDDWQQRIRELLKPETIVVINSAHATEHLLWEVQQVAQGIPPEHVILLSRDDHTPEVAFVELDPEVRRFVSRCTFVRVPETGQGISFWFRDRKAWGDYVGALENAFERARLCASQRIHQ